MKRNQPLFHNIVLLILMSILTFSGKLSAQDTKPYVRIANIVVDSSHLEGYKAALKEHAAAAIRKEPGVLTLYAVYDKAHPVKVTVFEIYASVAAYQSHIKTAHFLQYKSTVEKMVKSLVLTDVVPIALERKGH